MAVKDYYGLLEVPPAASSDEIKKAFRAQIAKYHPDKVQHLGKEFQAMAAERAAELTEAYRILCDERKRAEYDATRGEFPPGTAASGSVPPQAETAPPVAAPHPPPPPPPPEDPPPPSGGWFSQERATGAVFVKKALVGRFRQALDTVARDYDVTDVRGFDFACNPKPGFFGRGKGPRLLARYVDRVDATSIANTWNQAARAVPDDVCVFLMGPSLAPPSELAAAISDQRRRTRSTRVTMIAVDTRDWDAKIPTDAPPIARSLVSWLRA